MYVDKAMIKFLIIVIMVNVITFTIFILTFSAYVDETRERAKDASADRADVKVKLNVVGDAVNVTKDLSNYLKDLVKKSSANQTKQIIKLENHFFVSANNSAMLKQNQKDLAIIKQKLGIPQ